MEIKATIYDVFGYLTVGIFGGVVLLVAYGHSTGRDWTYVRSVVSSLTTPEIVVILALAYLGGHFVSVVTSVLVDKPVHKLSAFKAYQALDQICSEGIYKTLSTRFEDIFDAKLGPTEFRMCLCYAESVAPRVYQTAFVFLAFYGMARHVSFVLAVFAIRETVNGLVYRSWIFGLCAAAASVGAAAFFYHYLRYLRYFRQHIVGAFLVASTATKSELAPGRGREQTEDGEDDIVHRSDGDL